MQRKIYGKAAELGCPSRINSTDTGPGRRAAVADTNGMGYALLLRRLVIVMSGWGHTLPSRSHPAEVCYPA